jgi:hypothetical protein
MQNAASKTQQVNACKQILRLSFLTMIMKELVGGLWMGIYCTQHQLETLREALSDITCFVECVDIDGGRKQVCVGWVWISQGMRPRSY